MPENETCRRAVEQSKSAKKGIKGKRFKSIHHRFVLGEWYRLNMIAMGWNEDDMKEWDKIADPANRPEH